MPPTPSVTDGHTVHLAAPWRTTVGLGRALGALRSSCSELMRTADCVKGANGPEELGAQSAPLVLLCCTATGQHSLRSCSVLGPSNASVLDLHVPMQCYALPISWANPMLHSADVLGQCSAPLCQCPGLMPCSTLPMSWESAMPRSGSVLGQCNATLWPCPRPMNHYTRPRPLANDSTHSCPATGPCSLHWVHAALHSGPPQAQLTPSGPCFSSLVHCPGPMQHGTLVLDPCTASLLQCNGHTHRALAQPKPLELVHPCNPNAKCSTSLAHCPRPMLHHALAPPRARALPCSTLDQATEDRRAQSADASRASVARYEPWSTTGCIIR